MIFISDSKLQQPSLHVVVDNHFKLAKTNTKIPQQSTRQ
jgi:hypothetical protein